MSSVQAQDGPKQAREGETSTAPVTEEGQVREASSGESPEVAALQGDASTADGAEPSSGATGRVSRASDGDSTSPGGPDSIPSVTPQAADDMAVLSCQHFSIAEVDAIAALLLHTLASAVAVKRKREVFPRSTRDVAKASRVELCQFLDELGAQGAPISPNGSKAHPQFSVSSAGAGERESGQAIERAASVKDVSGQARTGAAIELQSRSSSEKTCSKSTAEPSATEGHRQGENGNTGEKSIAAAVTRTKSAARLKPGTAVDVLARHDAALESEVSNAAAADLQTGGLALTSKESEPDTSEQEWTPPTLQLAPYIRALLDPYVERQHNLLSRVSSSMGVSIAPAIEEAFAEIRGLKLWGLELRRDLARMLIQRFDMGHVAHCGEVFAREEQLRQHVELCPFGTVQCENKPCPVFLPLAFLLQHDNECRYKPMPCPQGCLQGVPRGELSSHCSTVCPMRVIPCPFAALPECPCDPFPQKELQGHLTAKVQEHQMLLLHAAVTNQQTISNLAQHLSVLEKAQELHEKASELEVRAVQVQIQKADQRITSVERQVTLGNRDWRQHHTALKKEAEALRTQVQVLLKRTES